MQNHYVVGFPIIKILLRGSTHVLFTVALVNATSFSHKIDKRCLLNNHSEPTVAQQHLRSSITYLSDQLYHHNVGRRADQGNRQDHRQLLQEREQGGGELSRVNKHLTENLYGLTLFPAVLKLLCIAIEGPS